mmetsp:Transcript_18536/g.51666  ORF Transcript_18536/g.51666 Transcript_18536/m.51666 type:complete len:258 (+) Transcript_18536:336-1109(+)
MLKCGQAKYGLPAASANCTQPTGSSCAIGGGGTGGGAGAASAHGGSGARTTGMHSQAETRSGGGSSATVRTHARHSLRRSSAAWSATSPSAFLSKVRCAAYCKTSLVVLRRAPRAAEVASLARRPSHCSKTAWCCPASQVGPSRPPKSSTWYSEMAVAQLRKRPPMPVPSSAYVSSGVTGDASTSTEVLFSRAVRLQPACTFLPPPSRTPRFQPKANVSIVCISGQHRCSLAVASSPSAPAGAASSEQPASRRWRDS